MSRETNFLQKLKNAADMSVYKTQVLKSFHAELEAITTAAKDLSCEDVADTLMVLASLGFSWAAETEEGVELDPSMRSELWLNVQSHASQFNLEQVAKILAAATMLKIPARMIKKINFSSLKSPKLSGCSDSVLEHLFIAYKGLEDYFEAGIVEEVKLAPRDSSLTRLEKSVKTELEKMGINTKSIYEEVARHHLHLTLPATPYGKSAIIVEEEDQFFEAPHKNILIPRIALRNQWLQDEEGGWKLFLISQSSWGAWPNKKTFLESLLNPEQAVSQPNGSADQKRLVSPPHHDQTRSTSRSSSSSSSSAIPQLSSGPVSVGTAVLASISLAPPLQASSASSSAGGITKIARRPPPGLSPAPPASSPVISSNASSLLSSSPGPARPAAASSSVSSSSAGPVSTRWGLKPSSSSSPAPASSAVASSSVQSSLVQHASSSSSSLPSSSPGPASTAAASSRGPSHLVRPRSREREFPGAFTLSDSKSALLPIAAPSQRRGSYASLFAAQVPRSSASLDSGAQSSSTQPSRGREVERKPESHRRSHSSTGSRFDRVGNNSLAGFLPSAQAPAPTTSSSAQAPAAPPRPRPPRGREREGEWQPVGSRRSHSATGSRFTR